MTRAEMKEAKAIQQEISKAAYLILHEAQIQSGNDVHIAMAAMAVAMCSLARGSGMLFNEMQEAINIAFEQVNEGN